MSYTFSRRAFLKYSAATAGAVAGASLLGGCEYQDPKNPVCKKLPGKIISDLQVTANLKSMKIKGNTCTLMVDIQSDRANPIPLDPYRFSIAVKDAEGKQIYFSGNNGGMKLLDAPGSLIQQRKLVTLNLEASGFPELKDGETVLFKYIPIRENSEFSMNWEITKEVYEKFIANQNTSEG